jgi:hypothetical protein
MRVHILRNYYIHDTSHCDSIYAFALAVPNLPLQVPLPHTLTDMQ